MRARVFTSVAWLWIASLFVSTVGVSGQQIYCYCLGKTSFSLFSAKDACAKLEQQAHGMCCGGQKTSKQHDCCNKKDPRHANHGCNQKTTRVFQLKTEFTLQEKGAEWLPSWELSDFVAAVFEFPYPDFGRTCRQVATCRPDQLPPPLSGRMICVRHGVFRC